jgi:hypothetical protein
LESAARNLGVRWLKGRIISYVQRKEADGSLVWKALVIAENGQLGEVNADLVQTWVTSTPGSEAEAAPPPFSQGDKVRIKASNKDGIVIQVAGDVYTVGTVDGQTVNVTASEMVKIQ